MGAKGSYSPHRVRFGELSLVARHRLDFLIAAYGRRDKLRAILGTSQGTLDDLISGHASIRAVARLEGAILAARLP